MVVSSVQHSDSVFLQIIVHYRFPGGSENAGDLGLIPGSGRSPREGNGTPLQYSCLENPMERGAWQATVHGVAKSRTQLSDFTFTFIGYYSGYTSLCHTVNPCFLSTL